jgi:hypothetical protein
VKQHHNSTQNNLPINHKKTLPQKNPSFTKMSAPAPNTTTGPPANDARDPSGFLSEIIGAPVTVKLNSGVVYKGT